MLGFNLAQIQLERSRREKKYSGQRQYYRREQLNEDDLAEIN